MFVVSSAALGLVSKCRIPTAAVAQRGLFRILLVPAELTEADINAEFIARMGTNSELRKQFSICTTYKYNTENPLYIKARAQLLSIVENLYKNTVGTGEGPAEINKAAEYIVRMNTDTELRKQFNICIMYEHDTENPIYIKAREQILLIAENIRKNINDNIGQVSVVDTLNKETVAAFLTVYAGGDTGPGGSAKGPCAIPGMFGCAPAAASAEYGAPWYPSDGAGIAPWPIYLAS
jgi:hypothetical protein